MPISDANFNAALDWIVQATTATVNNEKATEYFTTVFLVANDKITVQALVPEDDEDDTDPYDLLHDFGTHLAKENRNPDAVFVAAEAMGTEEDEFITVTGGTSDGRVNYAELVIKRQGIVMKVIGPRVQHYYAGIDLVWRRNPAFEVMRGLTEAGATNPIGRSNDES